MRRPASPPSRGTRALAGADLELYCATAASLVLSGRLSRAYPDPEKCAAFLTALAPSVRGPLAAPATIDLGSGLPSLREVVSVEADFRLAPAWTSLSSKPKADYYRRLLEKPLGPHTSLEARLRRVDSARGVAAFEVVYDRYDPAESVFVRHTIQLEQEDAVWGDPFLIRRGDYSVQTNAFRDKMERFTQDESELAFLLLGKVPGLRVEEVVRGRVGPLWSPWAPPPEDFRGAPEPAFVLHLPLDRASLELPEDRNDDPFSTIYRSFLSEDSRAVVEDEARRLGYRVHKDRKFAVSRGAAAALRARLDRAGTRNLIYEV